MKTLIFFIFTIWTLNAAAQDSNESQQSPKRRREFHFDNQYPNVHDPVIAFDNGRYYVFSTGFNISVMSSENLHEWQPEIPALRQPPQWAIDSIQGYRGHTWAPDIIHANGLWYLYYSCSAFGKNTSAIGVAVNKTLDTQSPEYQWNDLGMVIQSKRGDNYNCIDPNAVIDKKGNPWLSFGSFWDGIQLVRLDKDMKTTIGQPCTIARHTNPYAVKEDGIEANNNEIEAPFIVRHGKYYYLFASAGLCCRGMYSTYHVIVGRAKNIKGPYKDKDGKRLDKGGGTILIAGDDHVGEAATNDDRYAGIGHNAVAHINGEWIFIAHGYDKEHNAQSKLIVKRLAFINGWPTLL